MGARHKEYNMYNNLVLVVSNITCTSLLEFSYKNNSGNFKILFKHKQTF